MKRIYLLIIIFLFLVFSGNAQIKKTRIIVVPSKMWCTRNGFLTDTILQYGKNIADADILRAFDENPDMKIIIGAMENVLVREGYNVRNIHSIIRKVKERIDNSEEEYRGQKSILYDFVKPDILVELYFDKKKDGPYSFVEFNVEAIDPYTGDIDQQEIADVEQLEVPHIS